MRCRGVIQVPVYMLVRCRFAVSHCGPHQIASAGRSPLAGRMVFMPRGIVVYLSRAGVPCCLGGYIWSGKRPKRAPKTCQYDLNISASRYLDLVDPAFCANIYT